MIISFAIIIATVLTALYFFIKWADEAREFRQIRERPRHGCNECDQSSYEYDGWW